MPSYVRFDRSELMRFTTQVFEAVGVPGEHAHTVATNLVQGELHGMGSHGISRLLEIYTERFRLGGVNTHPNVTIVQQSDTTALINGDHGPGAVVGQRAMEIAIEKAQAHGSGWVGAQNSSHYGAAFLFARQALPHGMIGISTTNAPPLVAPVGGTERILGTNPICIAVPTGERPALILDMATSVVARGKVTLAEYEGRSIPEGWAVGPDGKPTTSAAEGVAGRMLPLGGYKGFGLAMMVEVFSALLTGAMAGQDIGALFNASTEPQQLGHFFGVLDVSRFVPLEQFKQRVDDLVDYVKSCPREEGADEILVPGEKEARKAISYARDGIPLATDVIERLNGVAR